MTVSPSIGVREAGTSQHPVRRRLRRRPSLSIILVVVVAALAFVLNLIALQNRSAVVRVAVAAGQITQGSVVSADDFGLVEVAASFEGLDSLLEEDVIDSRVGWVADRPLESGDLISAADLVQPASSVGFRLMAIPASIDHAAGGAISVGDRIDVISVRDDIPEFVVSGVEVTAVADPDRGSLGGGSSYFVVVALDADQALDLAAAIDQGSVELVRATGAPKVDDGS